MVHAHDLKVLSRYSHTKPKAHLTAIKNRPRPYQCERQVGGQQNAAKISTDAKKGLAPDAVPCGRAVQTALRSRRPCGPLLGQRMRTLLANHSKARRRFAGIRREIDSLVEDFFRKPPSSTRRRSFLHIASRRARAAFGAIPAVHFTETDRAYEITSELPS
jgi:hypothetical protein